MKDVFDKECVTKVVYTVSMGAMAPRIDRKCLPTIGELPQSAKGVSPLKKKKKDEQSLVSR